MIPGGGSKGGGRSPLLWRFKEGEFSEGEGTRNPSPSAGPFGTFPTRGKCRTLPPEGETSRGVWL